MELRYRKTLRKFKKYSNRSSLSWSSSTNGTNSCTSNVNEQKLIYQTCSLSMNPYLQVLRALNNRCTKKNQSMPTHHLLDKSQRPKLPAKASLPKVPTPPREEESEEEENVATHLGGEDPLTSHFTIPTSHQTMTTDIIFLSVSSFFLPTFLILLFVVCIGN